jgi:hypothetical protein
MVLDINMSIQQMNKFKGTMMEKLIYFMMMVMDTLMDIIKVDKLRITILLIPSLLRKVVIFLMNRH